MNVMEPLSKMSWRRKKGKANLPHTLKRTAFIMMVVSHHQFSALAGVHVTGISPFKTIEASIYQNNNKICGLKRRDSFAEMYHHRAKDSWSKQNVQSLSAFEVEKILLINQIPVNKFWIICNKLQCSRKFLQERKFPIFLVMVTW